MQLAAWSAEDLHLHEAASAHDASDHIQQSPRITSPKHLNASHHTESGKSTVESQLQFLYMLGVACERESPTDYIHCVSSNPFMSRVVAPSIEKLPSAKVSTL
jgi:hypothetical protein